MVGGLFAVAVEADQRFANEFAFQIVLGEKFVVVDGIVVLVFDDFFGHCHQFVGHFAVVGEQGRGSGGSGSVLCRSAVAQLGHFGFEFLDFVAQDIDGLEHDFAILLEMRFLTHDFRRALDDAHRREGVGGGGGDVEFEHFGRDFAFVGRDRHVLHHILQLADIARPRVVQEQLFGFVVESDGGNFILLANFECKLAEEHVDVSSSFAQGGHLNGNGGETIIEVFAEASFGDGALHVDVGGGHNAHVGALHFARSDRDELAGFEHAEQSHLCLQGEFSHLVEKERSAVGCREIALAAVDTAGEGAFDVAKEFGIDGALGQRTAVECEIFFALARARVMYNAWKHFFADAVFALNEDREVDACDFERGFERTIEGIAVAHDAVALFDGL